MCRDAFIIVQTERVRVRQRVSERERECVCVCVKERIVYCRDIEKENVFARMRESVFWCDVGEGVVRDYVSLIYKYK